MFHVKQFSYLKRVNKTKHRKKVNNIVSRETLFKLNNQNYLYLHIYYFFLV